MSKCYRYSLILRLNYKKSSKKLANFRSSIEFNAIHKCYTESSDTVLKLLLMEIKFLASKVINIKTKIKTNKVKYKINFSIKKKKSYLNSKIKISG